MRFVGMFVVGLVTLSGCKNLNEAAREEFSQANTCPMDRVEARERSDLKPSMFFPKLSPPTDIAADPGRLKMWQDEQDKQRAAADTSGDDVFEVRGCGKQVIIWCHRFTKNMNRAMCTTKDYPPGMPKWQ